jgi:hypothetical protein
MERKLFEAKLLGEIYRIQKHLGIYNGTDGRIYGLLNGVQEDIEAEIENLKFISNEEVNLVCDELDPYYKGEKDLSEMPNYKELEMKLERKGLHRDKLISILEYLYLNERYTVEIEKLKSGIKFAKEYV